MKYLGLDVGEKTIGVAVSDDLGWTAQGVTTIQRQSWEQDLRALKNLIQEYGVSDIIVGLPLNMNGTEGPKAVEMRAFIKKLEQEQFSVVAWDERLSTMGAERVLLEADLSRAKRKKVINKMAAAFILQGYLDSKRGG
ncbi:MAG: Holliday junction resolvase RuvX [bacterium]|nr:Holliday junction resolvase RuvX [bacterium]